jgi:probable rRNA maturation factor
MVNLIVDVEEGLDRFNSLLPWVASAVSRAVERTGGPEKSQIGLLVVGEETMREFNLEHRGQDRPTDVLSFPLLEPGEEITQADMDPQTGEVVLGDIVLSLPAAERQADEYGHSLAREAAYLAVHGALHLMGYDHESEREDKLMRKLEESVLEAVGLSKGESAV